MKLEFLDDISDHGKFVNVVSERLIRLYDFDMHEALKLKEIIEEELLGNHREIRFSSLDFVEPLNCDLVLKMFNIDKGIALADSGNFECYLTNAAYKEMMYLMEPFCEGATGYQWLYDLDCPIDLLFSPGGTW